MGKVLTPEEAKQKMRELNEVVGENPDSETFTIDKDLNKPLFTESVKKKKQDLRDKK